MLEGHLLDLELVPIGKALDRRSPRLGESGAEHDARQALGDADMRGQRIGGDEHHGTAPQRPVGVLAEEQVAVMPVDVAGDDGVQTKLVDLLEVQRLRRRCLAFPAVLDGAVEELALRGQFALHAFAKPGPAEAQAHAGVVAGVVRPQGRVSVARSAAGSWASCGSSESRVKQATFDTRRIKRSASRHSSQTPSSPSLRTPSSGA